MTKQEAIMAGFQYELSKHAEDLEILLESFEKDAGILDLGKKVLNPIGKKVQKAVLNLGKRKKPISLGSTTVGKAYKTGKGIGTKKLTKRAPKQMGWESDKLLRRMDRAGM